MTAPQEVKTISFLAKLKTGEKDAAASGHKFVVLKKV